MAVLSLAAEARAEPSIESEDGWPRLAELVDAGRSWKLRTRTGSVRTWAPEAYDPRTAATIIYVHGYHVDLDLAWHLHHLPEQFAVSGVNALFIACEAPSSVRERVTWTSLSRLLREVRRSVGKLPRGPIIVVGHSGAHRTVAHWLDHPRVSTIVLLDGGYSNFHGFRRWLKNRQHRLIHVAHGTRRWSEAMVRRYPRTVVFDFFPPAEAGWLSYVARAARMVYVRSDLDHMALITSGVALPMLLRSLRIEFVPDPPFEIPLGSLEPVAS